MTPSAARDNFERLALKLAPNSTLLRSWPLTGGASARMTAIEIRLSDGQTQKLIVRCPGAATLTQNPDAAVHEYRLLQILKSAGLAVPAPHLLDQSCEIFPYTYLVIEYLDGHPEYAPANVNNFAYRAATQLALIHGLNSTNHDLSFLPMQSTDFDAPVTPSGSSTVASRIGGILAASDLSASNILALLHGDYWPGNMLWNDGQLVAVIDWEDAKLGDPLVDFAISRLDTLLIFGLEAMNEFTHQYQSLSGADFTNLPYWDLYAAQRAAPHLADWSAGYPQLGRPDITEKSMREKHRWFINMALESLSIR